MGDGRARGNLGSRALAVDMNPLVIAGGVGEGVDARLVDSHPVGDAKFLADQSGYVR